MKLDLAQFRDLQAFAQFSSDLDDRTKALLERGQRVNEVLKQGWDTPLKVEEQVVVIYAAVKGYLDQVEITHIIAWEKDYIEFMRTTHSELLQSIVTEQKITESTEATLKDAVISFNQLHQQYLMSVEA